MSNWRNRSVLARALVRAGEYEPAIILFESIVDINVNIEVDCSGLPEVEDKVWCLQELAVIVWRITRKRKKSMDYLREAIQLLTLYPQQFHFLDKYEAWREMQNFILFISPKKVIY
jgi:tetratricopeptide (TPR) repeat protein